MRTSYSRAHIREVSVWESACTPRISAHATRALFGIFAFERGGAQPHAACQQQQRDALEQKEAARRFISHAHSKEHAIALS